MRSFVIALALTVTAAPAFAADAPVATRGAMLRDAGGLRLGRVDQVRADGSVGLIVGSKYVVVPSEKLELVDGKLQTKLTKKEVSNLN